MDAMRLLVDLQKISALAQTFSGCLEADEIARRTTDRLVEQFDFAFSRIWLVEPDHSALRLVASSGMYTRIDGSFARVPMGAFKVGKIAQNRVPFLSNNLPNELWVKDREWAIANHIRGFAGYPLAIHDRILGVLVTFSQRAMEPEFLEVLQTLCTVVSIAIDTALQSEIARQTWQSRVASPVFTHLSLSDQLVGILRSTRLNLVGTERPLPVSTSYIFLQVATLLNHLHCAHCRLIYTEQFTVLEAIVPNPVLDWEANLAEPGRLVSSLGGTLQAQISADQQAIQVMLSVPYAAVLDRRDFQNDLQNNLQNDFQNNLQNNLQNDFQGDRPPTKLRIQCTLPLLQQAFTHLAFTAGFLLSHTPDETIPLITNQETLMASAKHVLWVDHAGAPLPTGIQAKLDLSTSPEQLRQAVETVLQGGLWKLPVSSPPLLSERELDILKLLTQGHRDRDIADRLMISESTVKFHMNNVLSKFKARTRYQAIYQAILGGWI